MPGGESVVDRLETLRGVECEGQCLALHAAPGVKELRPTFGPREVVVLGELPKTQCGRIVRRLLRQKYPGERLGDLSTEANPGAFAS